MSKVPEGYREISLDKVCGGAATALFNKELSALLTNVHDVNTTATAPRKITLEFIITPDEDREVGKLVIKSSSKLAPMKQVAKSISFYKRNGKLMSLEREDMDEFDDNVTPMSREN